MWPPSVQAPCPFGTTVKAQVKAFSLCHSPFSPWVGQKFEKGHMLSNKRSGKGRGKDYVCAHAVCLPKCALCEWRPCFPGSARTSPCRWQVVNEILFLLCLHTQLFLYLLNSCYLDLISFYFPFLFPFLSVLERRVREGLGECLAFGWSQPATPL